MKKERNRTCLDVMSRSTHSGLQFPVRRIHRLLSKRNYAECVEAGAIVHLAAAMEFLVRRSDCCRLNV